MKCVALAMRTATAILGKSGNGNDSNSTERLGSPVDTVAKEVFAADGYANHQGNIYTAEVNTGQRIQRFRRLDPQN